MEGVLHFVQKKANGRGRSLCEFVENWLAKSFTDGKKYNVKVYFPGEKGPEGAVIRKSLD